MEAERTTEKPSLEAGAGKLTQLPVARIKTIMKSSPDLPHVSQESVFIITKATVSHVVVYFSGLNCRTLCHLSEWDSITEVSVFMYLVLQSVLTHVNKVVRSGRRFCSS